MIICYDMILVPKHQKKSIILGDIVFHLATVLAVENGNQLVTGLDGLVHVTLKVFLMPKAH